MEGGRLEAFSDGVFAVAITLLALNLAVGGPGPHQPALAAKLAHHWPAFAAYAVSFATVGIIWVNHHALFRNISAIDRMLLAALSARDARRATIRFGLGSLVYIAGIGIAFVSAPASLALVGLVAVYYIFEQTPVRPQASPEQGGPGTAAGAGPIRSGRNDNGGQGQG